MSSESRMMLSTNGEPANTFADLVIHRIRAVKYGADHTPDFESGLCRGNMTPEGFVMLFDADFQPVEAANLFLRDHCYKPSQNRKWQKTQAAYADDLANWWTYLRAGRTPWRDISADDIRAYATELGESISVKTGRFLAPGTIARRVGTVEEFYRWAFQQGLTTVDSSPKAQFSQRLDHDRSLLAHTGGIRMRAKNVNRPKTIADENVSPMRMEDLKKVLERLGASPYDRDENDTRPIRDRLIAEVSLYTGMRVAEVVALTTYQIFALGSYLDETDPWKQAPLKITDTKGSFPRTVAVPGFLVTALLDHIDGERSAVLDWVDESTGGARQGVRTSAVFLNGIAAGVRNAGKPLASTNASRAFSEAVLDCGLTRVIPGFEIDPATGSPAVDEAGREIQKEIQVGRHTFHDLRHTFAVQYYLSEIVRGNPSPWKKLQARLGHRRLSTTQDIYLRHVEIEEASLSDAFAEMLKRQLDDAS